MEFTPIHLSFEGGTVVIAGGSDEQRLDLPGVSFDPRTNNGRAEGRNYRAIVEHLRAANIPYQDSARAWQETKWTLRSERTPYPHQIEAVETWWKQRGRGVVVLPTGTGKTFVAMLAIAKTARPALVVTWDASGGYGHPDHIAVHRHATEAFRAAADASRYPMAGAAWQARALYYVAIPIREFMRLGEEMRKRGVDMGEPPGGDENIARLEHVEPNCIVDVSAQYERKWQALGTHRTQIGAEDMFAKMPEDLRRTFMSREYFYRAEPALPAGGMLEDLFADLP